MLHRKHSGSYPGEDEPYQTVGLQQQPRLPDPLPTPAPRPGQTGIFSDNNTLHACERRVNMGYMRTSL
ncbi:hypothetical protein SKAU_G00308830 [Synaphobranchus kaupii]|uniref:Uncharacterized protein n=1 Tax=Synaphobranchus kaupii TaxID=118154 RepID=A0A9Q1IIX4_SYNKA|nr:hypothetical protein SKAU_G00308830 [Synaphobranchus kaupii]